MPARSTFRKEAHVSPYLVWIGLFESVQLEKSFPLTVETGHKRDFATAISWPVHMMIALATCAKKKNCFRYL